MYVHKHVCLYAFPLEVAASTVFMVWLWAGLTEGNFGKRIPIMVTRNTVSVTFILLSVS